MLKKYIITWRIGRKKNDPEKCVLPTITFVNTNHSSLEALRQPGFVLAIGWWDWSIKCFLLYA